MNHRMTNAQAADYTDALIRATRRSIEKADKVERDFRRTIKMAALLAALELEEVLA